jgi:outer membrane lipoprotein-sorting protein
MRIPRVLAAAAGIAAACAIAHPAALAAMGGSGAQPPGAMTAEQVVDKNVEVRGGLPAWRKIATIVWVGHLESDRSPVPSLPFRLEEKRPGKSRFEVTEPSQRSMRVFDGMNGWKMRPGQDGRPEVTRFTPQEVKFAREAPGLQGPLIDYRARGSTVELEGTEPVDGSTAYRIGVHLASGERQTVWIDAASFLEIRYDRTAHDAKGPKGSVSVRYRDYKEIEGLALPSVFEIGGAAGGKPDRMVIERVALNPEIDDREFQGLGNPRDRFPAEPRMAPK